MRNDLALPLRDRLPVLRILDANLNRASEGLRVVEEYVRFVLDDAVLASTCKTLRHGLDASILMLSATDLWHARSTQEDVGTQVTTPTEYQRSDVQAVVAASLKRLEQALRVLEEYGKTLAPELGQQFERLRYQTYELEKQIGLAGARPAQLAQAKLYVLIDGGADLPAFIEHATQLIDAGAQVLQLRDKQLADRELLTRARELRRLTRGHCLFVMNDRADLAVLADADGVHVGQEELSVKDARTIVGPRALVGVSTHHIEQARQAVIDGADYIGCGPTFPSGTKAFASFPGLAFLKQVGAEIRLPAFAIGGITLDTLPDVLACGISRVAVSGAISQAKNPTIAAQKFAERLGTP